jgi:hypothetical protein
MVHPVLKTSSAQNTNEVYKQDYILFTYVIKLTFTQLSLCDGRFHDLKDHIPGNPK